MAENIESGKKKESQHLPEMKEFLDKVVRDYRIIKPIGKIFAWQMT